MAEESKTAIATLTRNMQRIAESANTMSPYSKAFRGHSRTPAKNPLGARTSTSASSAAPASASVSAAASSAAPKKETYKQRQTRIRKQKANTRAARANSRNRVQGIRYRRSVTRKIIKK